MSPHQSAVVIDVPLVKVLSCLILWISSPRIALGHHLVVVRCKGEVKDLGFPAVVKVHGVQDPLADGSAKLRWILGSLLGTKTNGVASFDGSPTRIDIFSQSG